jgi:hypothetical protein
MNTKNKKQNFENAAKFIILMGFLFVIGTIWIDERTQPPLHPPKIVKRELLPCIALRPSSNLHQDAVVSQSGLHCVVTDFWQKRLHGAGHSWPGIFHQIIAVGTSDTIIDLNSHILHSDGHSTGIGVSSDEKKWDKTKTITVRNGVIDLRGMGTGVESHHKWDMFTIDEPPPTKMLAYNEPHLILENLLIRTDNIGIALTGDGNIIRNCVIESGGNGAIMIAGPNGQILNNTIILTAPLIPGNQKGQNFTQFRHYFELIEERRRSKAAIVLHQATGTLIIGNRIEVKDKSATRHNIYLTDGSKDIRIEGNTFIGSGDTVTLARGSSAVIKNNVMAPENRWWQF